MVQAVHVEAVATEENGVGLVALGENGVVYIYNPDTEAWVPLPPLDAEVMRETKGV